MTLRRIKWEVNFYGGSLYYGTVGCVKLYKIKLKYGFFMVYSKFNPKKLFNLFYYEGVCFRNLEDAKNYCQVVHLKNLVKTFVEV